MLRLSLAGLSFILTWACSAELPWQAQMLDAANHAGTKSAGRTALHVPDDNNQGWLHTLEHLYPQTAPVQPLNWVSPARAKMQCPVSACASLSVLQPAPGFMPAPATEPANMQSDQFCRERYTWGVIMYAALPSDFRICRIAAIDIHSSGFVLSSWT